MKSFFERSAPVADGDDAAPLLPRPAGSSSDEPATSSRHLASPKPPPASIERGHFSRGSRSTSADGAEFAKPGANDCQVRRPKRGLMFRRRHSGVTTRGIIKSIVVPTAIALPSAVLMIYTYVQLEGVSPRGCELQLHRFIFGCRVAWVLGAFLAMGFFLDGVKTVVEDVERLPFGMSCLPLGSSLICLTFYLVVWCGVGTAWYLEVVADPMCTGPYESVVLWVIGIQFGLIFTCLSACCGVFLF